MKDGCANCAASTGVMPRVIGAGTASRLELFEHLDQRQVTVDRRFAEPIGAMRPATVVEHPRQVAVQRQDEAKSHRNSAASAIARV